MKGSAKLAQVRPSKAWSKPNVEQFEPTKEVVQMILRRNNVRVEPSDTLETLLERAKGAG